jgi:uncharacterized protein
MHPMANYQALVARMAGGLGGWSEQLIRPAGLVYDEIPGQRYALDEVGHRPWPPPRRPWLMGQTWRQLLFAHWPVSEGELRRVVPEPLELDEYDGRAWLGITPFAVSGLRLQGLLPPPVVSSFLELNVRTHVRWRGRPGIYFFSLDCSSSAAVAAARRGYLLPYFRAEASLEHRDGERRFASRRLASNDSLPLVFRAAYAPDGPPLPVTDGSLERWLTERYCLYVVRRGRVLSGDIHHRPWPLRVAAGEIERNSMADPLGLKLRGNPLLHFGDRQDTLFWRLAHVHNAAESRPA